MMQKLHSVLLVDDDEIVNYINEITLKKAGIVDQIYSVHNGLEAIDFLNQRLESNSELPDIIFLDVNMPGMDGWDFLEEYKKIERKLKEPVIIVMLTTSLNPDDKARADEIKEINQFENKPLTQNTIQDIIQRFFAG